MIVLPAGGCCGWPAPRPARWRRAGRLSTDQSTAVAGGL